jgi:hypothetical protein
MFDGGTLLTIAVIVLGFIGQAMYFKGEFTARMENTEEDIADMKKAVRYIDTCDAKHEDVGNRFESVCERLHRLERSQNGKAAG